MSVPGGWPCRSHTTRCLIDVMLGGWSEEVHARTIVVGLVALLALIAFIGAVAGAATWGAVRLLTFVVS